MTKINDELFNMYAEQIDNLNIIYNELDGLNIYDYAGPLFMYCWEDNYLKSIRKILFVGQETNGWYDDYLTNKNELTKNLKVYKGFRLGEKYNTLFWQSINYINRMINEELKLNFLWTNVNKFGSSGIGRPNHLVTEMENKLMNILENEISIIEPDVCIFLTGPNYDNDIDSKISDVKYEKIGLENTRKLCRLNSKKLPEKSYRTYHPKYLRLGKCEYILDTLINLIQS